MIPTPAECLRLMAAYGMLANIREHSVIVARIAELLATGVRQGGADVSVELTVAAALLHDIGKTSCLANNDDHAGKGAEICLAEDLHELAPIVREHVVLRFEAGSPLTEKEIVYYADKRVNHEKVVELSARRQYILERYGNNDPKRISAIRRNTENWDLVEARIFAWLDYEPAAIAARIDQDPTTCAGLHDDPQHRITSSDSSLQC